MPERDRIVISVISVEDVGQVQAEEEEARELPASPALQQGQQVPLTCKEKAALPSN